MKFNHWATIWIITTPLRWMFQGFNNFLKEKLLRTADTITRWIWLCKRRYGEENTFNNIQNIAKEDFKLWVVAWRKSPNNSWLKEQCQKAMVANSNTFEAKFHIAKQASASDEQKIILTSQMLSIAQKEPDEERKLLMMMDISQVAVNGSVTQAMAEIAIEKITKKQEKEKLEALNKQLQTIYQHNNT